MKLVAAIAILFFLGKGCGTETVKDMQSAKIEYTASTRGFYQKLTLDNRVLSNSKNRDSDENASSKQLNKEQSLELLASFQEIDLDQLGNYKGLTEKRFYDGAAIGKLKIMYQGKTYESQDFDHGYPPVEIKEFVDQLVSLAK